MPSNRKFVLYFSWDKAAEAAKPVGILDNRFPALYELRRIAWPMLESMNEGEQGIAGFLDRIVLGDFAMFEKVIEQETGIRPLVLARRENDGQENLLAGSIANDVGTLILVSLDHCDTTAKPSSTDLEKVRSFLAKAGNVLIVCPHHYIGGDEDAKGQTTTAQQIEEHCHHGDPLVPGVQRLGGYARALLEGLGLPVVNLYGLQPATRRNGQPAPLEIDRAADTEHFLGSGKNLLVDTFNAHPHLPHLQPVSLGIAAYKVLARQPINLDAKGHPFTAAGNTHFNALLWAPPDGSRQGHVLVCDATLWSSAFKGVDSLSNFWRNLAAMPTSPNP